MKVKGHEATKANTPHIAQKQTQISFILDKKMAKVYKKTWAEAEAKRGKKILCLMSLLWHLCYQSSCGNTYKAERRCAALQSSLNFEFLLCTIKVHKPFNHKGTHCSGLKKRKKKKEAIVISYYTNIQANPVWGLNQQPQTEASKKARGNSTTDN